VELSVDPGHRQWGGEPRGDRTGADPRAGATGRRNPRAVVTADRDQRLLGPRSSWPITVAGIMAAGGLAPTPAGAP